MDDADRTVLQSATEFTASQVANQFFALSVPSQVTSNYVSDEVSAHMSTTESANCTHANSHSNSDKPHVQSSELDSSILAPYMESTALDSDETFPYTSTADKSIHPFSSDFLEAFRRLDAPSYAHVPRNVYMRKESAPSKSGQNTHFLRTFDGPFKVIGHPHAKSFIFKTSPFRNRLTPPN